MVGSVEDSTHHLSYIVRSKLLSTAADGQLSQSPVQCPILLVLALRECG